MILKNAPVLILDEATSSLDSVTEKAIQDTLDEVMKDKTVLVVAHRLSTIAHLDRILVFDKGRIIEDGSHAELLARKGAYHQLCSRQSDGFLPEVPSKGAVRETNDVGLVVSTPAPDNDTQDADDAHGEPAEAMEARP